MSRLWTTDGRRTECEDRARILETEFAISFLLWVMNTTVKIYFDIGMTIFTISFLGNEHHCED